MLHSLLYLNTKFLVDCGAYIEGQHTNWANSQPFPFNAAEIKFVLLTHAHFDHCGLLPKLYKDGFVGNVICTKATASLARVILKDAAKHTTSYTIDDVKKIQFQCADSDERFKWGKFISLTDNLRISLLRSSHILGAVSFQICWDFSVDGIGKSINFSGDIGNNNDQQNYQPLIKGSQSPFPSTNYLVVESTYGNRERDNAVKDQTQRRKKLAKVITDVIIENNGKLIIPTFAMQRAQELLIDLYIVMRDYINIDKLNAHLQTRKGYKADKFKIFFDSKMLESINYVFANNLFDKLPNGKFKYTHTELGINSDTLRSIYKDGYAKFDKFNGFIKVNNYQQLTNNKKNKAKSNTQKKSINNAYQQSSIIVTSSGMCDAGPIVDYLILGQDQPNNMVLFTGFLAKNSQGEKILNGEVKNVKCKIDNVGAYYSGHADKTTLIDHIFQLGNFKQNGVTNIFLNHGTALGKAQLSECITQHNLTQTDIREIGFVKQVEPNKPWFDLNRGEYISDLENNVLQMPEQHTNNATLT